MNRIIIIALMFVITISKAQWVAINNGFGGYPYVSSIAVSGTNIFIGTGGNGVYLSTNNGNNWSAVNTGLTNQNIKALAANGSNLFAGTNGGGIFLSTNNGNNWSPVNNGLGTNLNILSFGISGTKMYAGCDFGGGIFVSTNNGSSWTPLDSGLTNTNVYAFAFSGTNIFAGTYNGVFLSSNNGISWADVSAPLSYPTVRSLAVSGTNVFAATQFSGMLFSPNTGGPWAPKNNGMDSTDWAMAVIVNGTKILVGSDGGGVFESTNNGNSWVTENIGLTNTDVYSLAVCGTNVFAGTWGGGMFRQPLSQLTGISEINNPNSEILISPNPTTGIFTIHTEGTNIKEIKVFDIIGNEILSFDKLRMTQSETIDVSGFAKGIYFLQITVDSAGSPTKNVVNKKIVVQ